MAILPHPFNHFDNWKALRFGSGLELMSTYVGDIEKECAVSVDTFNASDEGYEQQTGEDEQGPICQWVQVHKGLRDDYWDLNDIFRYYFPTLRRGSALAMLCSFVEHEFNVLCRDVQECLEVRVALEDIHGQGTERALRYLKAVATVDTASGDAAWNEMSAIFKVRNALIHAGGRADKKDVRDIVEKNKFLTMLDHEIRIGTGYLAKCIDTFNKVGDIMDAGLSKRFGTGTTLASRLVPNLAQSE